MPTSDEDMRIKVVVGTATMSNYSKYHRWLVVDFCALLDSYADDMCVGVVNVLYCLMFDDYVLCVLGPMVGGGLVRTIGFPMLMTCVGVINVLYCLLLLQLDLTQSALPILEVNSTFHV